MQRIGLVISAVNKAIGSPLLVCAGIEVAPDLAGSSHPEGQGMYKPSEPLRR
jgi:hypothetical protein